MARKDPGVGMSADGSRATPRVPQFTPVRHPVTYGKAPPGAGVPLSRSVSGQFLESGEAPPELSTPQRARVCPHSAGVTGTHCPKQARGTCPTCCLQSRSAPRDTQAPAPGNPSPAAGQIGMRPQGTSWPLPPRTSSRQAVPRGTQQERTLQSSANTQPAQEEFKSESLCRLFQAKQQSLQLWGLLLASLICTTRTAPTSTAPRKAETPGE